MAKKRVGILFGGKSVEHEVSLQSARNVYEAIDREKFEVALIGIDRAGLWHVCDAALLGAATSPTAELAAGTAGGALALVPGETKHALIEAGSQRGLPRLDVVFPVLHGTYGEDGTVQGLLKLANVPFVGAGVLGSAVGMDKDIAKRILRDAGIPVTRSVTLTTRTAAGVTFEELAEKFGAPFFVKPANSGSSVGVSKVHDASGWAAARAEALRYDRKLLVEEFIHGREIEVAVLGNDDPQASVPGEIIPQHDFYSYEAKYLDENGALLRIPADLPPTVRDRVRQLAVETFTALECAGMARVDFFVCADGRVYVNEINTIPGFTKISMYPKLWEATGLPYGQLIERLLDLAVERHRREQKLETSYHSAG
ncbi:MAG TPA: D-alanine--D-alanine ligase [Opitutaceae bacterium]|nr:D-alanine--D-alanine ligase [Opitutaceae bacterium]